MKKMVVLGVSLIALLALVQNARAQEERATKEAPFQAWTCTQLTVAISDDNLGAMIKCGGTTIHYRAVNHPITLTHGANEISLKSDNAVTSHEPREKPAPGESKDF